MLFAFPTIARSDEAEDIKKEIAETEKKIAELQKKLEELKNGPSPTASVGPGSIPESAVKKMNWRCIGPANMGGRITAIAVFESRPDHLLRRHRLRRPAQDRSTTAPPSSTSSTSKPPSPSAMSRSRRRDPNIVWVGTGENNPRNSVSYGDGVYKSTDGGKTWKNMGLKKSFQIGKIVIHPKDPNIVYVGALGRLYGPNEERGLFKTDRRRQDLEEGSLRRRQDRRHRHADGPDRPEQRSSSACGSASATSSTATSARRASWPAPDQYGPEVTYGPGGGLFRSTDGGKTWKKLTGEKATSGLPTVKTGRIGIDYSRKTKGLVYAIIDTENVGKGRPPLTVYMGMSSDTSKGGGVRVTDDPEADTPGRQGAASRRTT